ncbi:MULTISPECIES: hypothetical protein [unclassified Staphylococcus]|uniref:hypothetical protein n=1 Tax=unclassified Staphylococcus TaxID=91994 RepID=UPI0021CE044E|nr:MULTISPECIES: hypothetical protein [unclassified Staphylococcus]UXR71751.1 hypothetical protein MUA88_00640 [Staphylococcus sp. IVB6240]UXR74054.1 hypothetical protein MUA48_00820 [Staphylococcus sp. IVB6238]UXR76446.1 hypothetical protein MUA74_01180 [Staphylococcus sp. IVB6233]UXR80573.1 hypothetical protein MUA65_00790 [Staphylococcus sp. IVB6218]
MKNPWENIVEEAGNNYAEHDKAFLVDLINDDKYQNLDEVYKLDLGVIPLHYIGDIKSANVLVLSLNPSMSEEYRKNYANRNYAEVIQKNLTFEEPKFFEFDFYHEKKGFWDKLEPLFKKQYNEKIEKMKSKEDTTSVDKYFTEKIALVEYFPYHSRKYSKGLDKLVNRMIKKHGYLFSQKFVFNIIKERLRKRDVTIIITRSRSEWMNAIPELSSYKRCYATSSSQSPSFKKENLLKVNCGQEVLDAFKD